MRVLDENSFPSGGLPLFPVLHVSLKAAVVSRTHRGRTGGFFSLSFEVPGLFLGLLGRLRRFYIVFLAGHGKQGWSPALPALLLLIARVTWFSGRRSPFCDPAVAEDFSEVI